MNLPSFARRTFAMVRKEIMHVRRDKQVLMFALVMPVILLFILGFGVSFDVERISLVVVDHQESATSRQIVRSFTAGDLFEEVERADDATEIEQYFRTGRARAALVIPVDLDRQLIRDGRASVQLLIDGTDDNTATVTRGYAEAVMFQVGEELSPAGTLDDLPVEARARALFNPQLESSVFLVPGLIAVILVIIAVMLTALAVAREYERGSMEQLFTTPVRRSEIILGKLTPYFFIGLLQVLLVLTLGVALFDVPVRGSLVLLLFVSSIFLLAMLMQGLLISVLTRQQMLASQIAAVTTMLPALLLSGFIFPVDTMPGPIKLIAYAMPAKYFIDALRAILMRGNGLAVVAWDCVAMAGFFAVMMAASLWRFRRQVG